MSTRGTGYFRGPRGEKGFHCWQESDSGIWRVKFFNVGKVTPRDIAIAMRAALKGLMDARRAAVREERKKLLGNAEQQVQEAVDSTILSTGQVLEEAQAEKAVRREPEQIDIDAELEDSIDKDLDLE